jgi:plasmid replication initiation protein
MQLKERKEVIKHSAAIQVENSITLLQRRAWNVLLANAYDDLPTKDEYTVNVQELNDVLGYDSTNQQHLKDSLIALMTCVVEWNVLQKDGSEKWGATTLLASVGIEGGVCTYTYSPPLRQRLHNPSMYARINLSIQNKFRRKHALALYELCVDYLDMERNLGETPWIDIPRFRKLMGIPDEEYKEFKTLNKRVIKEPLAEINEVSDFHVEPEFRRVGRKVAAVKFKIQHILKLPTKDDTQGELPLDSVDTEGLPELVAEMVRAGVHRNKAIRIWSEGFKGVKQRPNGQEFDDYVREKLDLLQQESAKGKVDDKGAWLVSAIRSNFRHPAYQKRKQQAKVKEEIERLETEVKRLRYEKGKKESERLKALAADNDNLQSAFEQTQTQPLFDEQYHAYADNIRHAYEQNPIFAALINVQIRHDHAKAFGAKEAYDQNIEKTEKEINKLRATLAQSRAGSG